MKFKTYGDFINYFNGKLKEKKESFLKGNKEDLIEIDYYSSNSWERFTEEVMKDVEYISIKPENNGSKIKSVRVMFKERKMFSMDLKRSRVKGEKLGYRHYETFNPLNKIDINLYKEDKDKFLSNKFEDEYYENIESEKEGERRKENKYQENKDKFFEETGMTIERYFELEQKFNDMFTSEYRQDGLRERFGCGDVNKPIKRKKKY